MRSEGAVPNKAAERSASRRMKAVQYLGLPECVSGKAEQGLAQVPVSADASPEPNAPTTRISERY